MSVLALGAVVAGLTAACAGAAPAVPEAPNAPTTPLLLAIRAAHQPGHDRIVFEFSGPLPSRRTISYVSRIVADPSGRPVAVAGRALLQVIFSPAAAHNGAGNATVPSSLAFALKGVLTVVRSGDFESVASFGIGLAQRTSFHAFTLAHPSRVVIDIGSPSRTVVKSVYLFNQKRFTANTPPFMTKVARPVLATTPATGLLDRLFAGPTESERTQGLRLLASRATGFTRLSIVAGVARLRLTGGCSSGGSTVSIADEIMPTLKQLKTVKFVKIFDPAGQTEHPTGARDSIPSCLEP